MAHHGPYERIRRLAMCGVLALAVLLPLVFAASAFAADEYYPTARWPTIGTTGYSPLDTPEGIGIGPTGNLFVVDTQHARVQKYGTSKTNLGKVLNTIGGPTSQMPLTWDAENAIGPHGVTVDSGGNIYVADTARSRVVEYDSAGRWLRNFGRPDGGAWTQPGDLDYPWGVAVDSANARLYVTDYYDNTIQVFDTTADPLAYPYGICIGYWVSPSFMGPSGIALDGTGNAWISDAYQDISKAVYKCSIDDSNPASITASIVGTITGDFYVPYGVDFSPSGQVWVADTYHSSVKKFDPNTLTQIGNALQGVNDWALWLPEGVVVDSLDNVYVLDTGNNRVVKYTNQWNNDVDPPITTSNIPSGWVQGPFNVTLTAEDVSPIAYTLYGIDVPSPTTTYTAGGFWVSKEGTTSICFKSADATGNVEQQVTLPLQIDNTPPSTASNAPGSSVWTSATAPISLTASDALSGVQTTYYRIGSADPVVYDPASPIVMPSNAARLLRYWSVDNAGNAEAAHATTVAIDTLPPVSSSDATTTAYRGSAVIHITATDNISGVSAIYYSIDGGVPTTPYSGSVTINTEGFTTLKYYAVDQAGNAETVRSKTIAVNNAPPRTSSNIDSLWHRTDFYVSLTASDTFGVAATYYRINGGPVSTYTTPFPVTAEGLDSVDYWSENVNGIVETAHTQTVKIDKTAPSTTDSSDNRWYQSAFSLNLMSSDGLSGLDHVTYSINGGPQTVFGGPFDVTGDGYNTVQYWGTDIAGNVEQTRTATIKIDHTPPVTTCDATVTAPIAHLYASDTYNPIANSYYSLDGSFPTTVYNPSVGIVLPQTGVVTLKYFSQDTVGNAETVHSIILIYDSDPPVTTSSVTTGWHATPYNVRLNGSDPSGIAATYYQVDGGSVTTYSPTTGFDLTTEGAHTIAFWSVDNAGNTESATSTAAWVDATLPTSQSSADGDAAWHATTQTVTLTATDTPSGVGSIRYRVNGGPLMTYGGGFPIGSDGANLLEYFAMDVAGNRETTRSATVRIDKTPPTTSSNIDTVVYRYFTVHLIPTDAGAGVPATGQTYYKVGSGAVTTYTGDFIVNSSGSTVVSFWSVDNVGNKEPTRTATVKVDNTPPTTTCSAGTGWYATTQTVTLTATDTQSPVRYTYYSLNGGPTTLYAGGVTVSGEGTNTLLFHSEDNLGNSETTQTAYIRIDKTAPVTTPPAINSNWVGGHYLISLTRTDAYSGVATTTYSINGGPAGYTSGNIDVTTEGTNTVTFRSMDVAGNWETTQSVTVKVDKTPPVSTTTADSLWHKGSAIVTITASDALSGPNATYYQINGGAVQPYSGAFPVSTDGTNTLTYWSIDKVGNSELQKSTTVKVDNTPPVTTSNAQATYAASATISLTASDSGSGVGGTRYGLDGGAWTTGTVVATNAVGSHTLSFCSVDNLGNVESVKSANFDVYGRHEESDAFINYEGSWTDYANGGMSGGSWKFTNAAGGAADIAFNGTGVSWIAATAPSYGQAAVVLDGGTTQTVDLYSAANLYKQKVFTAAGLSPGAHSLRIFWTGSKNASSTGTFVGVDTIDVLGTLTARRFEETDGNLLFRGPGWSDVGDAGLSGGTAKNADSPGAYASIAFNGTSVDLIGSTGPDYGRAYVVLDGAATQTVDLYSAGAAQQQKLFSASGLAAGVHTMSVSWAGTRNASSSGTRIGIDAVDVVGVTAQWPPTRFEQTDQRLMWEGPWTDYSGAAYSGGDWRFGNNSRSAVNAYFSGSTVDLIGSKAPNYGFARISVDGGAPTLVDCYSSGYLYKQKLWSAAGLTDTRHSLRIEWTGSKNASSTNTIIGVDALDITGSLVAPRYEETDGRVVFNGSWVTDTNASFSGGAGKSADGKACSVLAFTGTDVDLIAPRGPGYGIAHVTLDGAPAGDVDLYAASPSYAQAAWSAAALTNGPHTLKVEWTGTKNPASSGTGIAVDAFDVVGTVAQADNVAPTTTSNADAFWHTTPFALAFSATDASSAVAATYYSVNGSPTLVATGPVTISTDGTNTVHFWSVDDAGNTEATDTATVLVDQAAPSTLSSADGLWHNADYPLTLTAADPVSGVAATYLRVGGGTADPYTSTVTVTGEGVIPISFWSRDRAGNVETTRNANVLIDRTAPVTTSNIDGAWHTAPVQVTLDATDTLSGVSRTRYTIDGGAPLPYDGPFVVSAEGTTTVRYWSEDVAGNQETTHVALVKIDTSSPLTMSDIDGAWHDRPVSFTLTATDPSSGVGTVYYRVGAGAATPYDGPVMISAEGTTSVSYWSVDSAGNTETSHTALVKIDLSKPHTVSDIDDGWHAGSFTFSLSATDATSGVAATYYSLGGGPVPYVAPVTISTEGTTNVTFWSVDIAGNVEDSRTAAVKVDKTAPSTTSDADAAWHTGGFTLHLFAADPLSGAASTFYTLNGGAASPYGGSIDVTAEGTNTVRFWSVDGVGNTEPTRTATVLVDSTAPWTTSDADGAWRSGDETITLATGDALSGVAATYTRIGNGLPMLYTGPFAVSGEGTIPVASWSVDRAGNTDNANTTFVRIDRTPPSTGSNIDGSWHSSAFSVSLAPGDSMSGVAHTYYSLDGGAPQPYSDPFTVGKQGVTNVTYWSVDAVGNVETSTTKQVKIDAIAPATTSDADDAWHDATVTVNLNVTDADSGVAATYYRLNNAAPVPYSGGVPVATEGSDSLTFWSVDAAGNIEATRSATVRVDMTAPVTTSDVKASYTNTATIALTPSDAVSGVSETRYRLDGGTWTAGTSLMAGPGSHTLEFYSTDVAGNVEGVRSASFDVTSRAEQDAPQIVYRGTWFATTDSGASKGSYTRASAANATARFAFTGTSVKWYSAKSSSSGLADVAIDGGTTQTVDLYNPTTLMQQNVWSATGLANGLHTVTIAVRGSRSASSTGNWVPVDALDVVGSIASYPDAVPPVTTSNTDSAWHTATVTVSLTATDDLSPVAQTSYRIDGGAVQTYGGPFQVSTEGSHTLTYWSVDGPGNAEAPKTGSVKIDRTAPVTGSNATPSYSGTATITLSPTDAVAGVSSTKYRLDGGSWTAGTVVTAGPGSHTLDYYSSDSAGNVEATNSVAFDVTGRYEQSDARFYYEGSWSDYAESHMSGGSWKFTNATGAAGDIAFTGTSITLRAAKAPNYGIARVILDGTTQTVDLYSSGYYYQQPVFTASGLSNGRHWMRVEWTGSKNASSTGTFVGVDALDIVGTPAPRRFEQTDTDFVYNGAWTDYAESHMSGGSHKFANASGASASLAFYGTSFDLIAATAPNYGKAAVRVDGGATQTIDLYSAGYLYQQKVFSASGLAPGIHTVSMSWTGSKNASSTGTFIALDAADITGVACVWPPTRYEQTSSAIFYEGSWTDFTAAAHSGGSFKFTNQSKGAATVVFNGTGITWITGTAPNNGKANVVLDGGVTQTVDLYTSGYLYQQKVFSATGLAPGTHTLRVSVSGSSNASSTGTFIGVDAFDVNGSLTQRRYEQTVPETVYKGSWSDYSTGALSGGSHKYTNVTGSEVDFAFYGSSVDWIAATAPNYGKANVVLDGEATQTVDLYSAGYLYQQRVFSRSGLGTGLHTLKIQCAGSRNASSTGNVISFDAVDLIGVSSPWPPNRFEQTSTPLYYEKAWTDYSLGSLSGGSYKFTNVAGAAVDLGFSGTSITWVTSVDKSFGKADVILDGTTQTVDLYSPTYYAQQAVWSAKNLSPGHHSLRIVCDGTKNPASTNTQIGIDALDTDGAVDGTWYEQTDPRYFYEGPWSDMSLGALSGGTDRFSSATTAAVDVSFSGTSFTWISRTAPNFGKASVSLDGTQVATVDLYSAGYLYQQPVWTVSGLADGPHTLRIACTGSKNASSTGTFISFDSADVIGNLTQASAPTNPATRYEETSSLLSWQGKWTSFSLGSLSSGAYQFANTTASVDVRFDGTGVKWITSTAPSYGIASLSVDGGPPVDVDLYSAGYLYQQPVWSNVSLAPGTHTLHIEWTGRANPASTGTYVGLDAVDVIGSLLQAP